MLESGLMHKWITEKMPIKDKCWEIASNNQVVNERKVNVADMQGIFFVLFMGTMIYRKWLTLLYCNTRRSTMEYELR